MSRVASPVPAAVQRKARAEAAAWVVRLHGPNRTPAVEAAFRQWLSAVPENRREFERVSQVWDDSRGIPLGGVTRLSRWTVPRTVSRWAIAAGVLLTCGVGGFIAYQIEFAGIYKTGAGEQRIVHLEDGTRISLNSGTKLDVSFGKSERHVTLTRGEAYFEVAHNPSRPFIVTAGSHDVTAVGTSFLIRYDVGRTAVTLVEGKVTVSNGGDGTAQTSGIGSAASVEVAASSSEERAAPKKTSGEVVTLTPGERLILSSTATPTLDQPRIDAVTAWRRGEVVLERTRLDEAVAEMNRYEERKLVIESPEIARLRISGIYHVGDSAGFAETVGKLYHLHVTYASAEIRIAGRESGAASARP